MDYILTGGKFVLPTEMGQESLIVEREINKSGPVNIKLKPYSTFDTPREIKVISVEWNDYDSTIDEELKKAKSDGESEIDGLSALDDKKKESYKKQIGEAKDKTGIQAIIAKAKIEDYKAREEGELEKAKEKTKTEIKRLDYLSSEAKDDYIEKIEKAENSYKLLEILLEAEAGNTKAGKDLELEKAKETAKNAINDYSFLSPEEKASYVGQIEEAENPSEVSGILSSAEEENTKAGKNIELGKAKEAAKTEIDSLSNLSDEQKAKYKNTIDEATDEAKIKEIKDEAKTENNQIKEDKDLKEAKEAATAEIDKLKWLSSKEISSYKEKIDKAEGPEAITKIVDEAKNKNKTGTPSSPPKPTPVYPSYPSKVSDDNNQGKDDQTTSTKVDERKEEVQKAETIEKLRISYREVKVSRASLENLKSLSPDIVRKNQAAYDDLLAKADQRLDITGESLVALTREDLEKAVLGDIDPESPKGQLTLSELDLEISKESLDNLKIFAPDIIKNHQEEFDAIYKRLEERLEKTKTTIEYLK